MVLVQISFIYEAGELQLTLASLVWLWRGANARYLHWYGCWVLAVNLSWMAESPDRNTHTHTEPLHCAEWRRSDWLRVDVFACYTRVRKHYTTSKLLCLFVLWFSCFPCENRPCAQVPHVELSHSQQKSQQFFLPHVQCFRRRLIKMCQRKGRRQTAELNLNYYVSTCSKKSVLFFQMKLYCEHKNMHLPKWKIK